MGIKFSEQSKGPAKNLAKMIFKDYNENYGKILNRLLVNA